jgi:hypothetical protein
MGYTFKCDDCGEGYNRTPAFVGEFMESFLKSTSEGGLFADAGYSPGQKVTICRDCMQEVVL